MMIEDEGYCLIQYFKHVIDHSGGNVYNEKGFPRVRKTSKLLMDHLSSQLYQSVMTVYPLATIHHNNQHLELVNVSSTFPHS